MIYSFNVEDFNRSQYEKIWKELNNNLKEIEKKEGLYKALEKLYEQQLDIGFIQDDLSNLIRYHIKNPEDKEKYFSIQYNPQRAERNKGKGRTSPPKGIKPDNNGCFLCKNNIRWQQRGIEFGYEINIHETDYIIWMNPFPIMQFHTTIAKAEHTPQNWIEESEEETQKNINKILSDLIEICNKLPNFIGFYNGEKAGASIPEHFHFHFFKRPDEQLRFPLEIAADHSGTDFPIVLKEKKYPIATVCFRKENKDELIKEAAKWVNKWTNHNNNSATLSANIIVTQKNKQFQLYFIPRNKHFSNAPGMQGLIGGLEVLGELVYCYPIEKETLIDSGRIDFSFIKTILHSVEAPEIRSFIENP